jgi:hypothetical protein
MFWSHLPYKGKSFSSSSNMVTIALHIGNDAKIIMTMGFGIAMAGQDKITHQKTFGFNMARTTLNISNNNKVIMVM